MMFPNICSRASDLVFILLFLISIVSWLIAVRSWFQRAAHAKEEESRLFDALWAQEEEDQKQREAIDRLLFALQGLIEHLCDTDPVTEMFMQESCEERGEPYSGPEPVEGCEGFFVEARALQKVLSHQERALEGGSLYQVEVAFYQEWVCSLQERYNQWRQRQQAIAELKQMQRRLRQLEHVLCHVHGVRVNRKTTRTLIDAPWRSEEELRLVLEDFPPFQTFLENLTYEELYQKANGLFRLIAYRIEYLGENEYREPSLSAANKIFAGWVGDLEECHEMLDGNVHLFTSGMKELSKRQFEDQWHFVIASASLARPDFLHECLLVSDQKYEQEYTLARRSLLEKGPCGQKSAMEHFKSAMIHWTSSSAMYLLLRKWEVDFADPLTVQFYAQDFSPSLGTMCNEGWRELQESIEAFYKGFEQSHAKCIASAGSCKCHFIDVD